MFNDNGDEIKVVPFDTVEQAIAEKAQLAEELEKLKSLNADKTDNIVKMRNAKDEIEKTYLEKQEVFQRQLEELSNNVKQKDEYIMTKSREDAIKEFVGDNAELAEAVRTNIDLININVVTPDDMRLKVEKAAQMAGITNRSPLTSTMSGGFPNTAPKEENTGASQEDVDAFIKKLGMNI